MSYLRRIFSGGSGATPSVLPRRYVWRCASHGLFGVAALDPCGNVLLRWREGASATGSWVRAQASQDPRIFPLQWEAAMRVSSGTPSVGEKSGKPNRAARDEHSGILRLQMSRFAMKRTYRLHTWSTLTYKAVYYAVWAVAILALLALYRVAKHDLANNWLRSQLTRGENAVCTAGDEAVRFLRRMFVGAGASGAAVKTFDDGVRGVKDGVTSVTAVRQFDPIVEGTIDAVAEPVSRVIAKAG